MKPALNQALVKVLSTPKYSSAGCPMPPLVRLRTRRYVGTVEKLYGRACCTAACASWLHRRRHALRGGTHKIFEWRSPAVRHRHTMSSHLLNPGDSLARTLSYMIALCCGIALETHEIVSVALRRGERMFVCLPTKPCIACTSCGSTVSGDLTAPSLSPWYRS